MKTQAILILFSFISSAGAQAWGQNGHRIVGELADRRLTPTARAAYKKLMGNESLARASTWADEIRSHPDQERYKKSYPWHYIEILDGKDLGTTPRSPEGDALTAMEQMEKTLRDSRAEKPAKVEALRFLIHFVSDIHMPLHVGNGRDRGGNSCTIVFFDKRTNLHSIWDTDLIERRELSYTEYARFLDDHLTPQQQAEWTKGTYADWINESFAARETVYPQSQHKEGQPKHPYCKESPDQHISDEAIPKLGYDYAFQMQELLDRRLTQGGLHLAHALNRIFDAGYAKRSRAR